MWRSLVLVLAAILGIVVIMLVYFTDRRTGNKVLIAYTAISLVSLIGLIVYT